MDQKHPCRAGGGAHTGTHTCVHASCVYPRRPAPPADEPGCGALPCWALHGDVPGPRATWLVLLVSGARSLDRCFLAQRGLLVRQQCVSWATYGQTWFGESPELWGFRSQVEGSRRGLALQSSATPACYHMFPREQKPVVWKCRALYKPRWALATVGGPVALRPTWAWPWPPCLPEGRVFLKR